MATLTRIDHINMRVKDLDESARFYGGLFGFRERESGVRHGRRWAILGVPGRAYLCLYEAPELEIPEDGLLISHFGFHVEGFAGLEAELRRRGVKINYGGPVESGASRSIYIEDPSGHEIELSEKPGGGLG